MFRKITLNTLASSVGRVIGGLLALVSIGLITRALGPEGFGQYATVVAYLSTFQILADLGLYAHLTKEIAQNPKKEKDLVSNYFTLRLVFAGGFLFLASALIFVFPYSSAVKLGAVFAAAGFLFLSLSQIFLGVFQKHLQVHKAAIAEVAGRVFQLAVVAVFFFIGASLNAFLAALVLGAFVGFFVNFIFVRKLVKFKLSFNVLKWRGILRKTLPIAFSVLFTLLYFKLDTILLSIMRPQSDVGIYNAAYKVLETLIFFPAAFMGIMLPVLSKYATKKREKFSALIKDLNSIMTVIALPVAVGGVLLSATIIHFIGGVEFYFAVSVMQVLFIAVGVIFFGTLYGAAVIALGIQKKAMWIYLAGFVINFALNLWAIPRYSYMGAAWTTVATEILITALLAYLVWREQRFGVSLPIMFKVFAATAAMAAAVWYWAQPLAIPMGAISFLLALSLGVAVYFVASLMFGQQKYFNKQTT